MLSDDIKKDELKNTNDKNRTVYQEGYIRALREYIPEIQSLEKELEAEKKKKEKILNDSYVVIKENIQHQKDKQELAEALLNVMEYVKYNPCDTCYLESPCKDCNGWVEFQEYRNKAEKTLEKHYNKKWEEL